MVNLSVCFDDSVTKEQRQQLPQILSPQKFEMIPGNERPIFVKTVKGKMKVTVVSRHGFSTGAGITVVPAKKK